MHIGQTHKDTVYQWNTCTYIAIRFVKLSGARDLAIRIFPVLRRWCLLRNAAALGAMVGLGAAGASRCGRSSGEGHLEYDFGALGPRLPWTKSPDTFGPIVQVCSGCIRLLPEDRVLLVPSPDLVGSMARDPGLRWRGGAFGVAVACPTLGSRMLQE